MKKLHRLMYFARACMIVGGITAFIGFLSMFLELLNNSLFSTFTFVMLAIGFSVFYPMVYINKALENVLFDKEVTK